MLFTFLYPSTYWWAYSPDCHCSVCPLYNKCLIHFLTWRHPLHLTLEMEVGKPWDFFFCLFSSMLHFLVSGSHRLLTIHLFSYLAHSHDPQCTYFSRFIIHISRWRSTVIQWNIPNNWSVISHRHSFWEHACSWKRLTQSLCCWLRFLINMP